MPQEKSGMGSLTWLPLLTCRLKKDMESVKSRAEDLAQQRDRQLQIASRRTREYGQVTMATDNLFYRCLQKSKVSHPTENMKYTDKLGVAGDFMLDLMAIVRAWEAHGSLDYIEDVQGH